MNKANVAWHVLRSTRPPDFACMATTQAGTHEVVRRLEKAGLCPPTRAAEVVPRVLSTTQRRPLLGSSDDFNKTQITIQIRISPPAVPDRTVSRVAAAGQRLDCVAWCVFVCVLEHREANATAGCHPSDAVWRRAAAHQVHQHERADGRPHEGVQGPAGDEYVERAGEGHVQRKVSETRAASRCHKAAVPNWWGLRIQLFFPSSSVENHIHYTALKFIWQK